MKIRSVVRITFRLLFFCAWLAVGLIALAMFLPRLGGARMASRNVEIADGGVKLRFEKTAPLVESTTPSNEETAEGEAAKDVWGDLSGINGEVIGDSTGDGEYGLGVSGTGKGGGGTGYGTIGIGSIGAGAAPAKRRLKSTKVASPKRDASPKAAGASPGRRTGDLAEMVEEIDEVSELLGAKGGEPEGSEPPERVAESSEPDDVFSDVDRKLANLPLGNIAFNTPETIPFGEDARIELLVSLKEAEEELRQAIRAAGPVESARVKISDQMEARLTGLGFRIEAITPERQAVTRGQRTQWQWQIEPNRSDTLELHLTLSALIEVDGVPATRAVRTFERTIYVEVPLVHRVTDFLAGHLEVLLSFVLLPVAGGVYRHVRKKKRNTVPSDDAPPTRRAA